MFTVDVDLALGADLTAPETWVWTTVTDFVRSRVEITRGRSDEEQTSAPSKMTVELDNSDGRFSRLNPAGVYFGELRTNTPVRVRVTHNATEYQRYAGFISELAPSWEQGVLDKRVRLVASGYLRRLTASGLAVSPLRAYVRGLAPHAHWPMEDEAGSQVAASTVPGVSAMTWYALGSGGLPPPQIQWAATEGPPGALSAPTIPAGLGGLRAAIPATSNQDWTVAFSFRCKIGEGANPAYDVIRLTSNDEAATLRTIRIRLSPTELQFLGTNAAGTSVWFPNVTLDRADYPPMNDQWHSVVFRMWNDAGTLRARLVYDDLIRDLVSTATLGALHFIDTPDYRLSHVALEERSISHVAVWSGPIDLGRDYNTAMRGYAGETATDRVARVCAENDVQVTVTGGSTPSERMGAQPTASVLDVLRDCEAVDGGVLTETTNGRLGFVSRSYFMDSALAAPHFELTLSDIPDGLEVADDDQRIVNDATVTRDAGGSTRYADQASVDEIGRYDKSLRVNLYEEDATLDYASWAVTRGVRSNTEYRYTMVPLDLAVDSHLIPDWVAGDIGARIDITEPLPTTAPDAARLFVEGYSETLDSLTWRVSANTSSAVVWRTGDVGDPETGRVDTAGSELLEAATSTQTSIMVNTFDGPEWITTTTHPAEFPFKLDVAGEVVEVSACEPTIRDKFARTEINGWGTAPTGQTWTAVGGPASDYLITGSTAQHRISANDDAKISLLNVDLADVDVVWQTSITAAVTGQQLVSELLTHYTSTTSHYRWEVGWQASGRVDVRIRRMAGGGTVIVSAASVMGFSPGSPIMVRCQARDGLMRMRVWASGTAEPQGWDIYVTDTTHTSGQIGFLSLAAGGNTNTKPLSIQYHDIMPLTPQTMTVTRSINSLVKSHDAGTPVSLHEPLRLAL